MRYLAFAFFIGLLGGCAQTPPPAVTVTAAPGGAVTATTSPPSDPLTQLANFTVSDLQAASADAHAQTPPDVTAFQCYDFLVALIPTIKLPGQGQTVGAFVAFQKLRDLQNGATSVNGTLKSLNLACAPLVIDTQTTINKLILLGAGGAATGGALAPGLGALGTILP